MMIDLNTFMAVTASQCLLLAAVILTFNRKRSEAWLLVGFVCAAFLYIFYKLGAIGVSSEQQDPVLSAIMASETLPAALIISYAVNTLFRVESHSVYWVFLLPVFEIAITWVCFVALGGDAAWHVRAAFVPLGQAAILIAGASAIWLAKRHFNTYENQSADNRRFVAYLLLIPAGAVLVLNALWVLAALEPVRRAGVPSIELMIIAMISAFQIWLVLFLIVGTKGSHKPALEWSPSAPRPVDDDTQRLQADFDKICALLESENLYLDPDLSLAQLSLKVGMNRSRVSAAINAQDNLSFSLLINRMRVDHAKSLLSNSEMSVIDIALEAGFSSKSTFNRVFKDIAGTTPGQWRATHKAG